MSKKTFDLRTLRTKLDPDLPITINGKPYTPGG